MFSRMVAEGQDGAPWPHGVAPDRPQHGSDTTTAVPMSVSGLVQDIEGLRARLHDIRQHDRAGGIILQRFLNESTVYA